MDPSNNQMRPTSQSQQTSGQGKPPNGHPPQKPPPNGCADVKPRLTKEQHDILEAHFQQQHKPSTNTKKGFAEALGVPIDKINNWFQNRRAKVKQDLKKQINQYNMSMGIYGPPQIPVMPPQFPPRSEQPQPQMQMAPNMYPVNADISPASLPVQSVEGPSALDLGPQMQLQQPFDMHHSLRSIPEADRATSFNPNAVMHSFMAATAGASYLQNHANVSLPQQESGFAYDNTGLSNSFGHELSFSVPSTLPNESVTSHETFTGFSDFNLDFPSISTTNSTTPVDVQNSTGTGSSEPSPFSGNQSTVTTQSSNGPTTSSVASIASMYSGWTDEGNSGSDVKPTNDCDDPFNPPYNLPQASASEQALPFWGPNGTSQAFSQADLYQHPNASAQAILSSPESSDTRKLSAGPSDFDSLSAFGDDAFARRNSSTSNLANNIEAIHIQATTPDGFKQPSQPSTIAARRQKRPTALNSSTLRSASYTSGMPSPGGSNNDHTLRRIRSSGIPSAGGRIQKPTPGSAQRSPMAMTFADAAASPKFARTFSSSSTTTVGQGGNLAPLTPLTPNEQSRFPYWQGNPVIRNSHHMPDHSSPESLNTNWSVGAHSGVYSKGASPPSTPLDLGQLNQARLANENLYRDTPPQSAPATQQSFPRTAFMQAPQMRAGFHSTTDLTIAQPKPSHFRRPSLPDTAHGQLDGANMQYPVQLDNFNYDDFKDISLNGITHNVPFAPPVSAMPDFLVHEYNPPQGGPHAALLRRTTEPQPKSYIFANQGPGDFRAS